MKLRLKLFYTYNFNELSHFFFNRKNIHLVGNRLKNYLKARRPVKPSIKNT